MSTVQFPPKLTIEVRNLVFDFISSLGVGETISSAASTSSVWTGPAGATSTIVSGSASISGTKVTQKVAGGTNGAIYMVTCTVVTSAGQTITQSGMVAVVGSVA